ncbi:uncharacterized protein LOC107728146 isoform X2 [Sinocyclocheilus rhinocerous]|uniref:uncharacterized protein LOC107728146 isoform X2 n=1 Tax=Sinocyclocheilus rhinocerous TaxID=307959 RepID=UPI0007B8DD3D|nr:PREDICTED: uncharacterized protein LOC107728146 isoform X2 [Sinocyclocheilus rhinocerous]
MSQMNWNMLADHKVNRQGKHETELPLASRPTTSAKSPNLRGGGREPLFTRHQPAATRGWGRDLSRGSLQTHTLCDPTDPNELARDNTSGNLNTAETLRTSKELILQSHQQFKQAIIKEFSDPESEQGLIAADSELHNSESKAGTRRHPALPQCKTLLQKAPSQKRTEPSPWQQTQVPDQPLGKGVLILQTPRYVQQQSTTTSSSTPFTQVLNGGYTRTAGHAYFWVTGAADTRKRAP